MKPVVEYEDHVEITFDGKPISYKNPIHIGKWECVWCGEIYDENLEYCEKCGCSSNPLYGAEKE